MSDVLYIHQNPNEINSTWLKNSIPRINSFFRKLFKWDFSLSTLHRFSSYHCSSLWLQQLFAYQNHFLRKISHTNSKNLGKGKISNTINKFVSSFAWQHAVDSSLSRVFSWVTGGSIMFCWLEGSKRMIMAFPH